ncbi:MAG: tetratricopeptide repeat protein [Betaproteobacteria bacterium]
MDFLRAGQLADAEHTFLDVLRVDKTNAHARLALGITCYQLDRLADAERYLVESISLFPNVLPAYNNLGLVYKAMGQQDRAMTALRRAIDIHPHYVDALYNLALLLEENDNAEGAIESYRQVIVLKPDFWRAHTNLGLLLRKSGDLLNAHRHLELVAGQLPQDGSALTNLVLILTDLGRYTEAITVGAAATQLEPESFGAWEALGNVQRLASDASAAVISLSRAAALDEASADVRYELGLAQTASGDMEAASNALNTVARLRPDWLKVLFARDLALPLVYSSDQHMADCNAMFGAGLDKIEARLSNDSGWAVAEGVAAISGYAPFYLHYQGIDNTALQRRFGRIVETVARRAWPEYADKVSWQPRSHGGKARIGFVSAYLRQHSVGLFFANWIGQLDTQKFESFVWYTGEACDAMTEKIRGHATHFSHMVSDVDKLANSIHASRLDVIIYLDVGMHPHSQVLAALKLAPVQCAAFGHPVTTGIASVDYFLSAGAAEPEAAAHHYTEKLIRLPRFAISYARPDVSMQFTPLGLAKSRRPLVLCAQPLFKILPQFDRVIARIARELPGCRVAFFESLWPLVNEAFVARLSAALRKAGVDPQTTLKMLPIVPHAEYLGTLAAADVILDTPGFSGGNSSFDAIAMKAPIITWRGEMLRGRQTMAMLDIAGLPELASDTDDDYVRNAVDLASSPGRQKEVKQRMATGSNALFDDMGAVRALEEMLAKFIS